MPQRKEDWTGLTREDLEKHRGDIMKELAKIGTDDAADKEKLHNRLTDIEDHIKEQKKQADTEHEHKDTKSTIVVPPDNLVPAQHPGSADPSNPGVAAAQSQERKRGSWLSRWF